MKLNTQTHLLKTSIILFISICPFNLFPQKTDSTKTASPMEEEEPSVRFGLRVTPAYNWYNVLNKTAESGDGTVKFGGGLLIESNLTKTVSFQTGLGIDMAGGTIKYNGETTTTPGSTSVRYFYNKFDQEVVEFDQKFTADSGHKEYLLRERTFKQTYVSVPLNLRMKTSYFGKNRFYGQIGFELQFKWNAYSNDKSRQVTYDNSTNSTVISNSDEELTKLNIRKDIGFFNMPLNMGIGYERKLAGTTSLLLSVNYYLGFFNAFDNTSDNLQSVTIGSSSPSKNQYSSFKQDVRLNRLGLNIAILF